MTGQEFKSAVTPLVRSGMSRLNTFFSTYCEKAGCTRLELQLLATLLQEEALPVGALGEMLGISRGNISALCKTLQKKKLVCRQRSEEDERVVVVRLSPNGKALCCSLEQEAAGAFNEVCSAQTEETLLQIVQALQKLDELLEEINRHHQRALEPHDIHR